MLQTDAGTETPRERERLLLGNICSHIFWLCVDHIVYYILEVRLEYQKQAGRPAREGWLLVVSCVTGYRGHGKGIKLYMLLRRQLHLNDLA